MTVPVHFHPSQFPEAVSRQWAESLRKKQLNPKFHYVSYRQAQRWLELHQAYSPSRIDPDCKEMYDQIFADAAEELAGKPVLLVGLGCGGGGKDLQLVRALQTRGCSVRYVPCDVSHALALTGRQTVLEALPEKSIRPLVADLLESGDLTEFWEAEAASEEVRVFSFLGMIPNFEPSAILAVLKSWLRPQDRLVLSANLIPREEDAEWENVLAQYDNPLTRRWLMTALDDLDISSDRYLISFSVQPSPKDPELKQIVAEAIFSTPTEITCEGERYSFQSEDSLLLFFSNRYRPALFEKHGRSAGLELYRRHLLGSGEEGVWLARNSAVAGVADPGGFTR